jgi:PAS domain-containing protein
MEKRYVRKDGAVIWVNLTVSIVRSAAGDPLYLVGFIEDITQRRDAQSEASKSLSLLRATLESTADGILVVDLNGKILSFNQKMADMWEIPSEVFSSGDDQAAINAALDKLVYPEDFMVKVMELYRDPEQASATTFSSSRMAEPSSVIRSPSESKTCLWAACGAFATSRPGCALRTRSAR